MRFATVFTLGIAVVSTSASLVARVSIPPCYNICVAEADISGCASRADIKCLCNNPTYVLETLKCLAEICQGANLGDAIVIGESICLLAGATLSISTVTPTSGSAPATISKAAAAVVHDANLNSFVGLVAVGLIALAIS